MPSFSRGGSINNSLFFILRLLDLKRSEINILCDGNLHLSVICYSLGRVRGNW